MAAQKNKTAHWADSYAARVVAERGAADPTAGGARAHFTCASGITPSGTIHIGNFREIITVDLVARALRDRGEPVRFIYSWDDYDVFRKVPKNVPDAEAFEQYLRLPITKVPDPWGAEESYARVHEKRIENVLPEVGITPEYLYQAERYRRGEYAGGIRAALAGRETIREVLNQHRTEPLPADWWPVSVFSRFNERDNTTVLDWDGDWMLTYRCDDTGNTETVDIRSAGCVKLPWRVDWPMRWAYERVDFEPAGKEHHSAGGSYDTAREIASRVYGYEAPVSFKYDFISIKGMGGKISSSSGEVIAIDDVLEVYQPAIVRYLFAGTRPNSEFAISFDLDVIKIYEDYDRCERIYYGIDEVGEKKRLKESRIYELSQVDEAFARAEAERAEAGARETGAVGSVASGERAPGAAGADGDPPAGAPDSGVPADAAGGPDPTAAPRTPPVQVPFRHLCNLLLITAGDIEAALDRFEAANEAHRMSAGNREDARVRARCAWNWIQKHAPEDFRFSLRSAGDEPVELGEAEHKALQALIGELETRFDSQDEKSLQSAVYAIARSHDLEPADFFAVLYRVLIGKEKGPRLAGFLMTLGRATVLEILRPYRERTNEQG